MNCKIKISTTQTDYKGKSIFDRAAEELMIEESFSQGSGQDTIETTLYGDIKTENNECIITYQEVGEGMSDVLTEIKFNILDDTSLSILRTGSVDSLMSFERGKRHISVYNTGIMPFEICIYTKDIVNKILTDGTLELTYLVEIKGACAQKTIFKMEVIKR